jgi:hypothetical protein
MLEDHHVQKALNVQDLSLSEQLIEKDKWPRGRYWKSVGPEGPSAWV